MKRRKNQVPGEGGFDGDFGRFKVSNLSHQDDVRVLPQEGSQRRGEIESDLIFHLYLVDSIQLELNRVLGRHDIDVGFVQLRERGVKRIGLAAARRSRYQNHSIRFENGLLKLVE